VIRFLLKLILLLSIVTTLVTGALVLAAHIQPEQPRLMYQSVAGIALLDTDRHVELILADVTNPSSRLIAQPGGDLLVYAPSSDKPFLLAGRRQITFGDELEVVGYPQWSPDGRWLVVNERMEDELSLVFLDADCLAAYHCSGAAQAIIPGALVPVWTRDGRWLLYTARVPDDDLRVHAIPTDCITAGDCMERTIRPFNILGADYAPVVGANGRLAFSVNNTDTGDSDLFWVDLACLDKLATCFDEAQRLTAFFGREYSVSWSPDGRWLTFLARQGSSDWLHVFDSLCEGGTMDCMTGLVPNAFNQQWSPDGRWLMFTVLENNETSIAALDMACREPDADCGARWMRQITPKTDGIDEREAVWSPDGGQIAFTADTANNGSDIFTLPMTCFTQQSDCTRADMRQVSPNDGWQPLWLPPADSP
jgi:hypothetical protein